MTIAIMKLPVAGVFGLFGPADFFRRKLEKLPDSPHFLAVKAVDAILRGVGQVRIYTIWPHI